ncbi:hypothetical protein S40285_06444 [Stachybotrys chlorohalonatus IBT 40285]|uniref:Phosphoribulokinase/uridine kinase domain-containing protein n=1 Tax=Stachybotrys chlorohalonatus (strain IBT 40285) TaxID=1283841 RepID=A0A084QB85_STAC4|nr:hypothetical protein S40285_06444 [Stachybotrys chlorohalonata IBT 40285]
MAERKAIIIGISGCSSSGKTTLARLLRDIFPDTFVLHEDDFYKEETEIPTKNGLLDWDCAEAIDIPAMADALAYIRQHASFPPTLDSKEDQNSVGKCPVPAAAVARAQAKVSSLRSALPRARLCLVDGFLLYAPSVAPLKHSMDVRLFLRASYASAKARREARDGYVTIEGFWSDPPGYVDKIVWPNYVSEHAWMFEGGDVDGEYRLDVLEKEGIKVQKGVGVDADMEKTLDWAVDTILEELQKLN